MRRVPLVSLLWAGLAVASGCGNVGPPVAPENVGIGPQLERIKKEEAAGRESAPKKQPTPPVEPEVVEGTRTVPEDEVSLPPLMPVGGR